MLKGAFTALITPFKDGKVDYDALRKLVRFQIENGINGLVPLGTTGETPTLHDDEKEKILKIVVEEAKGKVPVIAGAGSNSTEKTVKEAKKMEDLGADYLLISAPYYNKPTQEGIFQHFKAVCDAVKIPIVVYNIKGRTGVNIETSTLVRLSKMKNIVAVKEASGDIGQMMDVIDQLPKSFSVLSGDDALTIPLIACGGRGIISVASNVMPDKMAEMVKYANEGDFESARAIHYELLDFFKVEFVETNPIPIKYAASVMGLCKEEYRLPMCSMQDSNKAKMKVSLEKLGLKCSCH